MPTILDLVKRCPGCGSTAIYPFTQDFDLRKVRIGRGSGRPVSDSEFKILKGHFSGLAWAEEVGVRIRTLQIGGELWHEPCHMLRQIIIDEDKRRSLMQHLVDVVAAFFRC